MKILALAIIVGSLFSSTAAAQTNEFKKEWFKLYDNVYFKTEYLNDKKLPSGTTDIRVFGFKNKQEYAAPIEISGNVTEATKDSKGYRLSLDKATVSVENDDAILKYKGNLILRIGEIMKDSVTLNMDFLDGYIYMGDRLDALTRYHVKPSWHEQLGSLKVNVGKPGKMDLTPPFSIDYYDFMLPIHVVKPKEFTRELSSSLQAGTLPLDKNDSVFFHSVYLPESRIENVPELQVMVSEMRTKADTSKVFDSEVLYYRLGNELGMSDATVTRDGDDYKIIYNGVEPKYKFTALYRNSAFPKFTEVKWENGSRFANDDLTRADSSRITQIKFEVKDNIFEMPRGFIVNQAKALSDFNNLEFFDFNKYYNDERIGKLTAGGYITADGKPSLITGGYIQPERERVEAEREKVRKVVRDGQRRYEEAKAWITARQDKLTSEYKDYSAGAVVCELPNNQAADLRKVKLIRKITKAGNVYDEEFYINDAGVTYPLVFDEDGDPCYTADGRTYYFTNPPENARTYFDNFRITSKYAAEVAKGCPQMPTFD